jgi:hypothetical protein
MRAVRLSRRLANPFSRRPRHTGLLDCFLASSAFSACQGYVMRPRSALLAAALPAGSAGCPLARAAWVGRVRPADLGSSTPAYVLDPAGILKPRVRPHGLGTRRPCPRMRLTLTMFLPGLLALATVALGAPSAPSATVRNGTYTGVSVPSFKQELFLGMPYAQPPLPPTLRFAAPAPLNSSWAGTRAADAYSPICIGYPSVGSNDDAGYALSEDCLTLNVVRPAGVHKGSNVPVIVWI